MNKDGVETIVSFGKKVPVVVQIGRKQVETTGNLFHRRDFHDDGSVSHTYGVDIMEKDFTPLFGKFMEQYHGEPDEEG